MTSAEPSLEDRIRRLYDDTTAGWVDVWGEHLHHGHYGSRGDEPKDHRQAQIDMIDALLAWGGRPTDGRVSRILDAGCGVGGSARHLATKLGARVEGITLSPRQRDLAEALSDGRTDVRFHVGDATRPDFPDNTFDMVWALESGEHMPDKQAFVAACLRVLRPGGRLVMATWCHRPTPPALSVHERRLLDAISNAYGRSLTWAPLTTYERLTDSLPIEAVNSDDWSAVVTPFWSAVIRSVFTVKGLRALAGGGRSMIEGAWGGLHMRAGLSEGIVRYVVFAATKSEGEP